jgi:ABC-type methionine transport system ATPase subunit
VPFSLELDHLPADVRAKVQPLAEEVGLDGNALRTPIAALPPSLKLRVRLGRALALEPRVLLAEHPNALLPPEDAAPFAADLAGIVGRRGLASLRGRGLRACGCGSGTDASAGDR